jgi:hypothetical protein
MNYLVSDANVAAMKSAGAANVNVGPFTGPAGFDNACRAAGPIGLPGGVGFAEYIRSALTDELKAAGALNDRNPAVTLSGVVEQLEFSSTSGFWNIRLKVNSSTGRSATVAERHTFSTNFVATLACQDTAEAYRPAVQKLIGNLVRSPEFKGLVMP